ncbi:hypothetical protein K3712_000534 [Escherichia coli]|nr:hypothetical protein [Escherichia coli]
MIGLKYKAPYKIVEERLSALETITQVNDSILNTISNILAVSKAQGETLEHRNMREHAKQADNYNTAKQFNELAYPESHDFTSRELFKMGYVITRKEESDQMVKEHLELKAENAKLKAALKDIFKTLMIGR